MLLYNSKTLFVQSLGFLPVGANIPERDSYVRSLRILSESYQKDSEINRTEAEYPAKRLIVRSEDVLSWFQRQHIKGRLQTVE